MAKLQKIVGHPANEFPNYIMIYVSVGTATRGFISIAMIFWSLILTEQAPPPLFSFHHLSFIADKRPLSCNLKTPVLNSFRNVESAKALWLLVLHLISLSKKGPSLR